jgi:hypothetical protein
MLQKLQLLFSCSIISAAAPVLQLLSVRTLRAAWATAAAAAGTDVAASWTP